MNKKISFRAPLLLAFFGLLALVAFNTPTAAAAAVNSGEASPLLFFHPPAVKDGEPFLLTVTLDAPGENLQNFNLSVLWNGREISLNADELKAYSARYNAKGEAPAAQVFEFMLAMPLDCKKDSLPLEVRLNNSSQLLTQIKVLPKQYPVQELTVEQKYVTPDPAVAERANREAVKNRAIFRSVTPARYWSLPLHRPVKGIITSEFGFRRVFNGQPRNPHRGVDFRGAEGVSIQAVADGKVVLAEEQYYSGNLVIIDHGLGVYSSYSHLSAFRSQVGDEVRAGQEIGLVGKTGRVTGPHLHFGFNVLGEAVTPEPFMVNFR